MPNNTAAILHYFAVNTIQKIGERNAKMDLNYFREKLRNLHEKSGMDAFIDWPFVYDEDEVGLIFVNQSGVFCFADNLSNWIESPLQLSDVVNLRYAKAFEEPGIDNEEDEPSESSIYIHFSSGEYIWLWNRHESYSVDVDVHLHSCESNMQMIDQLKTLSVTHMKITVK